MELIIHIIDDDDLIRSSLERLFEKKGHRVVLSRNGEEALRLNKEITPDLIFLDLSLPDINGKEVLKRILRITPHIPIVMISGYGTIEIAVETLKLGAWEFLTKPLNLTKVNATVENLLNHVRLQKELQHLRSEQQDHFLSHHIVGQNPLIQQCYSLARSAGNSDRLTILITGESGTGKEYLARYVHYNSIRSNETLVTVNCSALPKDLVESELFGYEKGAFTGAASSGKQGKFELAEGGTLFLDEIGDLHLDAQAKILRFLQERELQRVGSTETRHLNVRVIAATNQNLEQLVEKGKYREDLYYRLNVLRIHLPPLRERKEDIALFALHFINLFNQEFGKKVLGFSPEVEKKIVLYDWPGNIRELRNVIERAVHLAQGPYLAEEQLGIGIMPTSRATQSYWKSPVPLKDMIGNYVKSVLTSLQGNKSQAANVLKISRTRLRRILQGSDSDEKTESF